MYSKVDQITHIGSGPWAGDGEGSLLTTWREYGFSPQHQGPHSCQVRLERHWERGLPQTQSLSGHGQTSKSRGAAPVQQSPVIFTLGFLEWSLPYVPICG